MPQSLASAYIAPISTVQRAPRRAQNLDLPPNRLIFWLIPDTAPRMLHPKRGVGQLSGFLSRMGGVDHPLPQLFGSPSMEYRKLKRQPVTLVLAEFRFSDILSIESYVPQFQELIRKTYPIVRTSEEHEVSVKGGEASLRSGGNGWVFSSRDNQEQVRLEKNRLIYITTSYDRFPKFSKNCEYVLNALAQTVSPDLLERIGLRYNDTIIPPESNPIEKMLIADLLPGQNVTELGTQIGFSRTETQLFSKTGRLIIKSLIGVHGLPSHPELLPLFEGSGRPDIPEKTATAVLDIDHIWEAEEGYEDFSVQSCLSRLADLHQQSREAFWRLTTDYAKEECWQ